MILGHLADNFCAIVLIGGSCAYFMFVLIRDTIEIIKSNKEIQMSIKLTDEQLTKISSEMNEYFEKMRAETEAKRQAFISSGRFNEVLQAVNFHIDSGRRVTSDEYVHPILPATENHKEVSNQDLYDLIDILHHQHSDKVRQDPESYFEDLSVTLDGRKYAIVYGQGSFIYCMKVEDCL